MPLRILQVIPSMGMGGAERMIVDLMRILGATGDFDFQVCCIEEAKWYYEYKPARATISLNHRGRWRDWSALRRTVRALQAVVDTFQPDIIHSHLWFADFVTGLANRQPRIPHIVHFHDTCDWKTSQRLGFRFRRWLYSRVLVRPHVHFISCSAAVARLHESSLGIPAACVMVLPYGVDCDVFVPRRRMQTSQTIRIGTVGRFVEMKGHRYLFESVARLLAQRRLNVELVLAGDGPLREDYEDWIDELGIGQHVQLLGAIYDVPKFLQSLDIYVQSSSSSEALPIAVLEAMACGLPIVATRIAGIPEQIQDGVNGFLVAPCDSTALADAIVTLCEDQSLRDALGAASARRARELFSLETMAKRMADIYANLACSSKAHAHHAPAVI